MMTVRRDANTLTFTFLTISSLLILGVLGYAFILTKTSTATGTGSRMPTYVTGVYPSPTNLQKGYAASFPTIAELRTHLSYKLYIPRHLPAGAHLAAARIEPDMATSTLVYTGPSSTLRISETPIIVQTREPGSRPVRIHGLIAEQFMTTTNSTVIWIRRPLKYIVVASGSNPGVEALRVTASL